jgi:hypothetical protein
LQLNRGSNKIEQFVYLGAAAADDEAVVVVVFLSLSLADLTLNLRPAISFESIAFTAFSISSLFSVSAKAKLKKKSQSYKNVNATKLV